MNVSGVWLEQLRKNREEHHLEHLITRSRIETGTFRMNVYSLFAHQALDA
jgi:hypothetical protein